MARKSDERTFSDNRKQIINEIMVNDLHGKKIYLLGSAEFGPTNEPILIKSSIGLRNTFGARGTLIDAFHQVKWTSKTNQLYLVKTTGEHAYAYLNINIFGGEIIENGFILVSSESNEAFNEVKITIDTDAIRIKHPYDLIEHELVYYYKDYPTVYQLADMMNKHVKQHRSYVQAYYMVDPMTPTEHAFSACNPTTNYLYGGQCGLGYSKNLLYNCLSRTYKILESHEIDIVVPVDAFLDDIYPDDSESLQHQYNMKYYQSTKDYLMDNTDGKHLSFLDQLLNFCLIQNNFGFVTTGIIGFNKHAWHTSDYLKEADDLYEMYEACFDYNVKQCANPYYLFLVSAVMGDILYNRGSTIDNGYLAYAALCADTIYTSGTTNIPFKETVKLYHEFSEEILQKAAERGLVAFRHSPFYDRVVVYDGVTCYQEGEGYDLYVNVRMIQLTISYLNKLFQFYIGNDMHYIIDKDIMNIDVNRILSTLQQHEILTKFDYLIVPNFIAGHVKLYLTLLTNYMVKAVKLSSVIDLEFKEGDENE